eukprot:1157788-Pelagomonas_calceolata.AAC.4
MLTHLTAMSALPDADSSVFRHDGLHFALIAHVRVTCSHTSSYSHTSWHPSASTLQMLDRDLEEAEEQYGMAVRAHMLVVESLMDLQYQRMKALEADFAQDLKALERLVLLIEKGESLKAGRKCAGVRGEPGAVALPCRQDQPLLAGESSVCNTLIHGLGIIAHSDPAVSDLWQILAQP